MTKKIISTVLQLPLILIVVASFFGAIYAAVKKIGGVSYFTSVIIGVVIIAYFYGRYLENKSRRDFL